MSNTTYEAKEPIASDWLETRDPAQDLLPNNPCCLFTYEDAYNKSIPSRTPSLQCKCAYCGKIFLIDRHTAQDIIVKKRHHTFCSRICSNKFTTKHHQAYTCKMCGKQVASDDYYGSGSFCSVVCSRKYSSKFANSKESIRKKQETLRKYYDAKLGPNRKSKTKSKETSPSPKTFYKRLISKQLMFSISTIIQSFNYKHIHITIPKTLEGYIIEGAAYILIEMTRKWSFWDIKTLLNIKRFKIFKQYCKSLLIEDNPIFISCNPPITIKICRQVLNKPILEGSITINEKNEIAKECERLLYKEKWSTKKVCLEYLHCSTGRCEYISVLGARTYTVSEALINRHNLTLDQKTNYRRYRRQCKFNFTKELEEYLFNSEKLTITNDIPTKDHMVSVTYGFLHNIDPYLISHPANCMILSNSSNSSKNSSCSITINELIERVEWFNETILAKTEDYAKKYRNKTKYRLGNIFPKEATNQFKMMSIID